MRPSLLLLRHWGFIIRLSYVTEYSSDGTKVFRRRVRSLLKHSADARTSPLRVRGATEARERVRRAPPRGFPAAANRGRDARAGSQSGGRGTPRGRGLAWSDGRGVGLWFRCAESLGGLRWLYIASGNGRFSTWICVWNVFFVFWLENLLDFLLDLGENWRFSY